MAYPTLIEASKAPGIEPLKKGVILTFANESELMRILPFEDAPGGAVVYQREAALPGVAFRGINETYSATVGVVNPMVDQCVICGGEVVVDNFTVTTRGERVMAGQSTMQLKSIAADWTTAFFKGDNQSNPRYMSGLQTRLTGNQVISAGSTAGGAALSLSALDEAIDACYNPTHILLSKAMKRKITQAARDTAVGGYITTLKDEFGRPVMAYNNLPLISVSSADDSDGVLPFTEAAASGSATATSLYVVGLGPNTLTGIQTPGGIQTYKLGNAQGQMESRPARGFRVEWFAGIAFYHGRAAVRLKNIGNLAVVK